VFTNCKKTIITYTGGYKKNGEYVPAQFVSCPLEEAGGGGRGESTEGGREGSKAFKGGEVCLSCVSLEFRNIRPYKARLPF